jgi:capsular polysaccharide transport system permease protein
MVLNARYSTVGRQINIILALILHDIKSRFFGSGLGYVVTMLWPAVHIVAVIMIYVLTARVVPYGSSAILFAATGVIPFLASTYLARFIIMGAMSNKSYLQYPIIKIIDLFISRAILEFVSASLVISIMIFGLSLIGIDCMPYDAVQAAYALLASLLLGLGLGVVNGLISMVLPLWNIVFALLTIATYASSGTFFLPSALPLTAQYYLSFNPLLHAVVWMRSAYYPAYDQHILDKSYILEWGLGSLVVGLVSERLFRSVILSPR